MSVVLLVLAILAFVALLLFLARFPVARRARRQKAELEAELGDSAQRRENAQGLGLESRGNGWLVLTGDELRFRQWVPSRETRIPLAAITEVDTPRWWLGKSVGSRLLVVRWRTPEGGEDAMAWNVRDLDGWLAALRDSS